MLSYYRKPFPDYLFVVFCSVMVILIKALADILWKLAEEETEAQELEWFSQGCIAIKYQNRDSKLGLSDRSLCLGWAAWTKSGLPLSADHPVYPSLPAGGARSPFPTSTPHPQKLHLVTKLLNSRSEENWNCPLSWRWVNILVYLVTWASGWGLESAPRVRPVCLPGHLNASLFLIIHTLKTEPSPEL